jgi:hypothetical protein
MSIQFTNTEIIITPPSADHRQMGYAPDKWLVGVKTVVGGQQYGRVWQSETEVKDEDDPVAIHCRELLLAELRLHLGGKL